jgi:hypothetical protein
MRTNYLIHVDEFCANHNIEESFISSLRQTGMIKTKSIKEKEFIDPKQLLQLEKIVRLYYELDINLEGIETINYLLERINLLNDDIIRLKNRIRLYETE